MATNPADLVTELAGQFIELAMRIDPAWERAFFRYSHEGGRLGSNASYEVKGAANLIDPFANETAFRSLNEIAERLF